MRKFVIALAMAATLPLAAQDAPRIAFFNLSQVVTTSVKAGKIWTELEVAQRNFEEKMRGKETEAQKLQQQLQSSTISDQGREQIQKQLRDLEFDYKKSQEDGQVELRRIHQKVMGELSKIVMPIVETMAKERKLNMVIHGDQAAQMIAWADMDWLKEFTTELVKRLDGPDAAPAAAPAAKPAQKPAAKPAGKPAGRKG